MQEPVFDDDIYDTLFSPEARKKESEGTGFWDYAADAALGIPRGAAGAIEGILELPTAFGLDYDVPDNLGLGEPETLAGNLTDGIVNFGLGFALGGAGAGLSVASGVSKMGRAGKFVMGGKFTKKALQQGLRQGGIKRRTDLFTRGFQGAATDFMFFKGNEGRLADLIQSFPSLANPLSEFLATEEDDWEITGRLKNTLEGFGIGFLVDSLFMAKKALWKGNKVLEKTGNPTKARKAAEKTYSEEELKPWKEQFNVNDQEATWLKALSDHLGLSDDVMEVGRRGGESKAVDAPGAEQGVLFQAEWEPPRTPTERRVERTKIEEMVSSHSYWLEASEMSLGELRTVGRMVGVKGNTKEKLAYRIREAARPIRVPRALQSLNSLPDNVREGLTKHSNLGFDSQLQAWEAIWSHPDFFQRWQMTPALYKDIADIPGARIMDAQEAAIWSEAPGVKQDVLFQEGDPSIWDLGDVTQKITSERTSNNQLARVFKLVGKTRGWRSGEVNIDLGGGRFDKGTEYLADQGVTNYVYDPFNRSAEHNASVVSEMSGGRADTATLANVLNVIKEKGARLRLLQQANDAVKKDGEIYITVHEAGGKGEGGVTTRGWQNRQPLRTFKEEISEVLDIVETKNGVIIAKPRKADVLYQTVDPKGFYHKIWEGLHKLPDNLPLAQVKKSVGGKKTEWEFTGLDELLESNPRATVGDAKAEFKPVQLKEEIRTTGEEFRSRAIRIGHTPDGRELKYNLDEVLDVLDEAAQTNTDPHLMLSNDGRAHEALSKKFPDLVEDENWAQIVLDDLSISGKATRYSEYTPEGIENYRELVINLEGAKGVSGQHFDKNTLFHVRFGDEMVGDKKILQVFEIQSDWSKRGQRGGYEGEPGTVEWGGKEYKPGDLKAVQVEIPRGVDKPLGEPAGWGGTTSGELTQPGIYFGRKVWGIVKKDGTPLGQVFGGTEGRPDPNIWSQQVQVLGSLEPGETAEDVLRRWTTGAAAAKGKAPRHPMMKSWPEHAVQRMFKLAAEEGYDGIRFASDAEVRDIAGLAIGDSTLYTNRVPKAARQFAKKKGIERAKVFPVETDAHPYYFDTKSPAMGNRAFTLEPDPLFQRPDSERIQGMTEFAKDGKAFISGTENANVSTGIHEIGHVIRRRFYSMTEEAGGFTSKERETLNDWVGAEEGKEWGVAAEEKFARGLELYIREGKLPDNAPASLRSAFRAIVRKLIAIYEQVKGSRIDVGMNSDIRKIFDDLIERGGPQPAKLVDDAGVPGKLAQVEGVPASARAARATTLYDEEGNIRGFSDTGTDVGVIRGAIANEGRGDLVGSGNQKLRDLLLEIKNSRSEARSRATAEGIEDLGETTGALDLVDAQQMMETHLNIHPDRGQGVILEELQRDNRGLRATLNKGLFATQELEFKLVEQLELELRDIQERVKNGDTLTTEEKVNVMILERMVGDVGEAVTDGFSIMGKSLQARKRAPGQGAVPWLEPNDSWLDNLKPVDRNQLAEAIESGKTDWDKWYDQSIGAMDRGDFSLNRVAAARHKSGVGQVLMEVYYASLLSGLRTQVVNVSGAFGNSIFLPLERVIGNAAFNTPRAQDQLAALMNIPRSLFKALGVFKVAFGEAGPRFDPQGRSSMTDATGVTQRLRLSDKLEGLDEESTLGTFLNFMYGIATVPLRALGSADDAMKYMNATAHAERALQRRAMELFPEDISRQTEWVQKHLDHLIEDGQLYSAARMYKKAEKMAKGRLLEDDPNIDLENAKPLIRESTDQIFREELWDKDVNSVATDLRDLGREASFTTTNAWGVGHNPASNFVQGTGAGIQKILDSDMLNWKGFGAGRIIVPFVNTPTNLATWFLDRALAPVFDGSKIILSLKKDLYEKFYHSDPNIRGDALGRVATGGLMMSATYSLYSQGRLSGTGPPNPQERALLQETGWQPQSIKFGDTWVSYERLDPWASFFSVAADTMYAMDNQDPASDDGAAMETIKVLSMAFIRNLKRKTYLQGVSKALEAATDDEGYKAARFFRGFASPLMPTIVKDMNSDPYLREVRSFTDQWLSRTPGLSDKLPPRRNLLGEKIEQRYYGDVGGLGVMNPFAYSQVNNDVVKGELAHLGHGFSPPDSEKYGFNLRKVFSEKGQTAYDRFQELHGVVKLRGRTLEQSLERLFSSDRYQKMIDSPDSTTSPKVAEARKIISKYRAHAYRQIEKEFPELKNARLQSRKEYRARESGRSNSIQNILNY